MGLWDRILYAKEPFKGLFFDDEKGHIATARYRFNIRTVDKTAAYDYNTDITMIRDA